MIGSALVVGTQLLSETLFFHGFSGDSVTTGFPNPGTWLIFAVILVPVYFMVIAWFIGSPRDVKVGLRGVSYLVGLTTILWVFMLFQTLLIGIIFY